MTNEQFESCLKNGRRKVFINSSIMTKAYCPRLWWFTQNGWIIDNPWETKAAFGNAIHRGLAFKYRNPKDPQVNQKAIIVAAKYFEPYVGSQKNTDGYDLALIKEILQGYFNFYSTEYIEPIVVKDVPLVEQKFAFSIEEVFPNLHSPENVDVIFTGTVDLVANYMGRLVIIDHKTTGSTKQPKYFLEEFEAALATKFYLWAWKKLTSQPYIPFLINGIFIKQKHKFLRGSLIEFTDEQMEEFISYLEQTVKKLLEQIESPASCEYSACRGYFGTCQFGRVCHAEAGMRDALLRTHFTQKDYNPLMFQD